MGKLFLTKAIHSYHPVQNAPQPTSKKLHFGDKTQSSFVNKRVTNTFNTVKTNTDALKIYKKWGK
jgi:hypothetical protein